MMDDPKPLFPLPQGSQARQPQSSYPQVGSLRPISSDEPPERISPKVWALVATVSVVVVIAVTAAVTLLRGGFDSGSAPTARTDFADRADPATDDEGAHNRTNGPDLRPESAVDRFSAAPPPPTVRGQDTFDEACPLGFQLAGRSGWGTRSGRGSDQTSCFFANSVLHAYWNQHGSPDVTNRVVIAEGTVPCSTTGGECSGDSFVMRCAVHGQDTWITCSGGKNARVYIY